jgi:hypothetical protein
MRIEAAQETRRAVLPRAPGQLLVVRRHAL